MKDVIKSIKLDTFSGWRLALLRAANEVGEFTILSRTGPDMSVHFRYGQVGSGVLTIPMTEIEFSE